LSSPRFPAVFRPRRAVLSCCLAAAALAACGGGDDGVDAAPAAAADRAGVQVRPLFHMAPAQLTEPADLDAGDAPRRFEIDASLADLATARLTPARLAAAQRARVAAADGQAAAAIPAAVYTPAQIRAAYGLPPLPVAGAALSSRDAAGLGAGQTIYLVEAYDHPNAFADLAQFSARFGLPPCASAAPAPTAPLPPARAAAGCTFAVAYADSRGALVKAAPAYDADWIAEIALDVEWAHAIAPLARLVLIEVASDNSNQLQGGVALANRMGPGVVSMSFGAPEGGWVRSSDAGFAAAGMSYVAAAGDAGAQVLWPAVSPRVLAVGGTRLHWAGSGVRSETAWAGSGGGVSSVEPLPAWQSGLALPGSGAPGMRTVADVAFNADPATGQYVALTPRGSATTTWNSFGGTSIGAPQWAGLVAVANARRAVAARAPLGDFHAALYRAIAGSPVPHAAAFADIVDGRDGACATCTAAVGYDTVTGWGTPNAGALLDALAGPAGDPAPPPPPAPIALVNHAPVLPSGSIAVPPGVALRLALNGVDPDGDRLTYVMTGAPRGLSLSSAGVLGWGRTVRGRYVLRVVVRDSHGLASAPATIVMNVSN